MSIQALFFRLRDRIERLDGVSYRRLARLAEVSDKTVRNFAAGRDIGARSYDAIERAVTKLEPAVKVPSYHAAEVDSKRESMAA